MEEEVAPVVAYHPAVTLCGADPWPDGTYDELHKATCRPGGCAIIVQYCVWQQMLKASTICMQNIIAPCNSVHLDTLRAYSHLRHAMDD